jgi:predicted dehydrogenase
VHFIDLFNWLAGAFPARVSGVSRDHFGRGLEDLSLVILEYPGGLLAKVESGLIQPGRWADRVMPDAFTNKDVWLCGSEGAIAIDYHVDSLVLHRVRHELQDGMWRPVYGEAVSPKVAPAGPVDVVASELRTFLRHVEARTPPEADVRACGVEIAHLLEAIALSDGMMCEPPRSSRYSD